ncbi:hypothetical protein ABZ749_18690, partial [Micromonospora sp. NPDC047753]
MSATSSAGVPHPYLHRSAGRASVPGPDRGASGRARPTEARFYPSYDEEQPRPGGPAGPTGPGGPGASISEPSSDATATSGVGTAPLTRQH